VLNLYNVSVKDTGLYICFVYNPCGAVLSESARLSVNGNKAGFRYTVNNQTRLASFTNTSDPGKNNYYWDFDNNQYSNLKDVSMNYIKDGKYHVCLTVTDSVSLCQSNFCDDIKVGKLFCKADFTYTIDTASKYVSFSDASTIGTTNHYWEFGDGNTSV